MVTPIEDAFFWDESLYGVLSTSNSPFPPSSEAFASLSCEISTFTPPSPPHAHSHIVDQTVLLVQRVAKYEFCYHSLRCHEQPEADSDPYPLTEKYKDTE